MYASPPLQDINTIAQFGGRLQDTVARNTAIRDLASRRILWLAEDAVYDGLLDRPRGYSCARFFFKPLASPSLERLIASYLREYDLDGEVLVERLTYANPLDATLITASGGVVVALLHIIRDWDSRRRVGDAEARTAEVKARIAEARPRLRRWGRTAKGDTQPDPRAIGRSTAAT